MHPLYISIRGITSSAHICQPIVCIALQHSLPHLYMSDYSIPN